MFDLHLAAWTVSALAFYDHIVNGHIHCPSRLWWWLVIFAESVRLYVELTNFMTNLY